MKKWGKMRRILSVIQIIQTIPMSAPDYKTYMCLICGFIYDEAAGIPEEGIAAGTLWVDIPPNWTCPECGARKDDFEMVEI